jgi:hypothetical protein
VVSGLPERFMAELRRRSFGFVFQQFNLIARLSVRDNVMLPAYLTRIGLRDLVRRADALLVRLDLAAQSGQPRRNAVGRRATAGGDCARAHQRSAGVHRRRADCQPRFGAIRRVSTRWRPCAPRGHHPVQSRLRICASPLIDRVVRLATAGGGVIFHHAALAVLLVGAVTLLAVVLRCRTPWRCATDTGSGSGRQLVLERRTTLVSAVVAVMLVAQAAALLLFVFNADRMATMFVGAMCAVGTLQVNRWGFPALFAQIASLFVAGMWLTLNAVDVRSPHYPLTRAKHGLLLAVVPLSCVSFALQFASCRAGRRVITSCCGSMFSAATVRSPVS